MRKSFSSLTSRELDSLERGVRVMKSRPKHDPTSWWYQANMHGYLDQEEETILEAWGSCQHANWWFLPWHRAYLFAFERILRAASGDVELTLPYWDWTDRSQRALPDRFFDSDSPLFEKNRCIKQGMPIAATAVAWEHAFRVVSFASPCGGEGFGGPYKREPGHREHNRNFGALEVCAHNAVHTEIGHWMGNPDTAGRDPIFWLHHANVDRLWGEWLRLGRGRRNPDDPLWLETRFTFFDPGGRRIELSASNVLDLDRLGYYYDKGVSVQAVPPSLAGPQRRNVIKAFPPGMMEEVIATDGTPRTLGSSPQTVRLAVEPAQQPRLTAALGGFQGLGDADHRIVRAIFTDVRYDTPPSRYYSVYINLPDLAQAGDPNTPYFVGLITFFESASQAAMGHRDGMKAGQGASITLDLTENLRELGLLGASADSITITLVPSDARAGMAADPLVGAGPTVSVGHITIAATPE
ncbi:tyrosinase family protein [Paludisphaera rhizosphaerae]|uniref:tyrosinase family protein n=1 Tax=Paludisphaera rhizosphaerae TaxID=2711216 RepID=UPI0013E9A166|nr:tyrosinase family protein [Paludisphaera rhizosphaerae]